MAGNPQEPAKKDGGKHHFNNRLSYLRYSGFLRKYFPG
jgi:hypothetical protein